MDVLYDGDRYVPVSDFDAARGGVALGLRAAGEGGLRVVSRNQLRQTASSTFSPRSDLALDRQLGAVDGDLELGGLRLPTCELEAGASRATVRFSQPNAARCRARDAHRRRGGARGARPGQQPMRPVTFEGGVGKVTLDFGGAGTSS